MSYEQQAPRVKIRWGKVVLAILALAIFGGGVVALIGNFGFNVKDRLDQQAGVQLNCSGEPGYARGIVGGEKEGYYIDTRVTGFVKSRCSLDLDVNFDGSLNIAEANLTGIDFVSPGSTYLEEKIKAHYPRASSATVMSSPIVMIAWRQFADAMVSDPTGIATTREGRYYVDTAKFFARASGNTSWADVGVAGYQSKLFRAVHTDPVQSNSGNLFIGLGSVAINGGHPPSRAQMTSLLPRLEDYIGGIGFLESSSKKLWDKFLLGDIPLMVGYESSLLELTLENREFEQQIVAELVVMYPEPTVMSHHSIIAFTDPGRRVLAALQDPEMKKVAWERHGFRSGMIGVQNNATVLQRINGAPQLVTVDIPPAEVMDLLVNELRRARQ